MSLKCSPLDVSGELEVTFQSTCFRLFSKGSTLILRFDNLLDSNRLLSHLKKTSVINPAFISEIDRIMIDTGLTLCVFNKRFAILGLGANPLFHRMLAFVVRKG